MTGALALSDWIFSGRSAAVLEALLAVLARLPCGDALCFAILDRVAADAYKKAIVAPPPPSMLPLPRRPLSPSTTDAFRSDATLAVIIPLLADRLSSLRDLSATLSALSAHRDLLVDTAVVVVDDGSYYARDVAQIAKRFEGVRVIRDPDNRGAGSARNLGLEVVAAAMPAVEIVAFVDAGVRVTAAWCSALRHTEQCDAGRIRAGPVRPAGDTLMDRYYASRGTLGPRCVAGKVLYAPSCAMVWPESVVRRLRFNEEFRAASYEDVELCVRAQLGHGIGIGLDPRLVVVHDFGDGGVGDVRRRFARYGRYHGLLVSRFPEFEELFRASRPYDWGTERPQTLL